MVVKNCNCQIKIGHISYLYICKMNPYQTVKFKENAILFAHAQNDRFRLQSHSCSCIDCRGISVYITTLLGWTQHDHHSFMPVFVILSYRSVFTSSSTLLSNLLLLSPGRTKALTKFIRHISDSLHGRCSSIVPLEGSVSRRYGNIWGMQDGIHP